MDRPLEFDWRTVIKKSTYIDAIDKLKVWHVARIKQILDNNRISIYYDGLNESQVQVLFLFND